MKRIHPTIHTILVASCLSLAAGCGRSGPSSPADIRRTVDRYLDKKGVLYNSLQVRQNGLCTLDFRHMNITDLSVLNKVPLGELNIANTSISDLAPLKGNKTLTYLDVGDTQVSDLSPLAKLTKLTYLGLTHCDKVSDLSPVAKLTKLTSLQLAGCTRVSDLSPHSVANFALSLQISVQRASKGAYRLWRNPVFSPVG